MGLFFLDLTSPPLLPRILTHHITETFSRSETYVHSHRPATRQSSLYTFNKPPLSQLPYITTGSVWTHFCFDIGLRYPKNVVGHHSKVYFEILPVTNSPLI